ncbi:MAG TPA: hypothetical protein PKD85_14375, partial [Saprospiraceae bacterium]|nr:hypothetical protein [Saprospiraceae bacterium]
ILPWWIGGLVSFFCGLLLINKKYTSFVAPFLTASIVWITIAFLKDYNAEVSIAHLVSNIFKDMGEIVIYFMTGFTIAIICGFFGLSGNYFKRMITQNNVKSRR